MRALVLLALAAAAADVTVRALQAERQLLVQFQNAFGISDDQISVYVQGLMQKNNLSVFGF